ncbi:MAG TPA: DUF4854 domain-containing protein [Candidatus Mediterraneibacter pullistercoris]|nr:DUF4854 domain-containing protein [Candidatus Mediterraneibacter pullistercoris]
MKNKIRKTLLLVCAMMMALALTACGGSGNSGNSDNTDDAAQTADDASADDAAADDAADDDAAAADDTADDAAVTGKFASIQEFIDSDIMQEQLQTQMSALEGSGMSMEITGEDNKLIYSFKIDDPDLSAVMDTAALESALESQASTFESVAGILPTAIEVENPVVVVRYLDSDGNELVAREFASSSDAAAE